MIIVHEKLRNGIDEWQVFSSIDSCVISESLADRWLDFEERLDAVHADFPAWMYVREINDDLNPWWAQWSYGTTQTPDMTLDAAYAVGHLVVDEPSYVMVSRPLPQFAAHLDLERREWGYQFVDRKTGEVVWENRCTDNNHSRVFASKQWVLENLKAKNLLWAFDVWVAKERREKARWGYALAEERAWSVRAIIDQTGQIRWGSFKQTHRKFDSRSLG